MLCAHPISDVWVVSIFRKILMFQGLCQTILYLSIPTLYYIVANVSYIFGIIANLLHIYFLSRMHFNRIRIFELMP